MKKIFTFLLLLLLFNTGKAQVIDNISLSHFAPIPSELGLNFRALNKFRSHEKYNLYIGGDLAIYGLRNDNTNYMLGPTIRYSFEREETKLGFHLILGAYYNLQKEVTDFTVDFNGSITDKNKVNRHILLSSFGIQFSLNIKQRAKALFGINYASRSGSDLSNTTAFFGQLGVQYQLKK